ncbi:MAG TPA: GH116 family glycosyl hydrolase, partial [Fimbriimonadaceae bacterium]|nr:GH116 family glycosyl hydrolase [Fimbriimonadaceae bacterium]
WVATWYEDSTLPHWFLNRTMSSASTLATTTCFRLGTGRFYANEGVGCCAGTCTHVWHYAQSVGRLFPALERDTRERVDLGVGFVKETGEIWFRAEFDHSTAVDGQAGTVLRFLREHQMAPDRKFLKRNWPRIRKSVEYLIGFDKGEDGLLKGAQGNTLDAVWYGLSSWLSSLYLAALLAGERMAQTVGDNDFAAQCRTIFTRGQASMDRLYNGEYYFQIKDPAHAGVWGSYNACHIDQVFGQGWAWQVGLPRVLPKEKTDSALKAIWKYNFTPNVGPWREKHKPGRWYAVEGDAGLIICTNPKGETNPFGDANTWQNIYFTETWTGCEHQVAGHMIAEGLLTEGLSVVKAVDDRHDGNLRNPYNEIECSDHYTRAMSAFGPYVALTGFEIDGPAGHLGFTPRLPEIRQKFAWIGAEGWGTYSRTNEGVELTVRHGSLRLRSFRPGLATTGKQVQVGGMTIPHAEVLDPTLVLHFPHEVRVSEGEALRVTPA